MPQIAFEGSRFRPAMVSFAIALLWVGGVTRLVAQEAGGDVGLLFGDEIARLENATIQAQRDTVRDIEQQIAEAERRKPEAIERRDDAARLKQARELRLQAKALQFDAAMAQDRLEVIQGELAGLQEKVDEASRNEDAAQSEVSALDTAINQGRQALPGLREEEQRLAADPVLALEKRAPNVVRYLAPFSSLVVDRRRLVLLLAPGVRSEEIYDRLQQEGLRVTETMQVGGNQRVRVERDRAPGEITASELTVVENTLSHLVGTGKVEEIMPEQLLFAAAAGSYADSDDCIKKVLGGQPAAVQDPCVRAAVKLRLPITLALLRRPAVIGLLATVKVGILDIGFNVLSPPLVNSKDEHGELVRRVMDFALGEWQNPRPLTINWCPAAAKSVKVIVDGVERTGVPLSCSLRLLEDLDALGVRAVNVSLGANEFEGGKPQLDPLILYGRSLGHQQLIDDYAKLSPSLFVASAAGNDASCWPGYKAIWSSPLNAARVRPIQVVAQLDGALGSIDSRSNAFDVGAVLAAPSGTISKRCLPTSNAIPQSQTSFATPYVTAVAALIAAILPNADGTTLRAILRETTLDGVPDALAASLCALKSRGVNPWMALADMNGDYMVDPSDRNSVAAGGQDFNAIYFGADLNGDGKVGGATKRKLFGVDLTDEDLLDIAAGQHAAPALPAICQ